MIQWMKLREASGHEFYNTSPFTMAKLVADPQYLRSNLSAYLAGFSPNVRDIFERFEFDKTLNKLAEKNKLFAVTEKFAQTDFHPQTVSNIQMGLVFEELIRPGWRRGSSASGHDKRLARDEPSLTPLWQPGLVRLQVLPHRSQNSIACAQDRAVIFTFARPLLVDPAGVRLK